MKLVVTENAVVVDEKDDNKVYKSGDVFERRLDDTVHAWLDAGHVEEVIKEDN